VLFRTLGLMPPPKVSEFTTSYLRDARLRTKTCTLPRTKTSTAVQAQIAGEKQALDSYTVENCGHNWPDIFRKNAGNPDFSLWHYGCLSHVKFW
jgi:hypothetical protein